MRDFSGVAGLPFPADRMRLIGEGFNTQVFLSPEKWVLKVAKYHGLLPRLVHERDSLRLLPVISVDIPGDYEIIEPCSALPFGGSYYRYIEGTPCTGLTRDQQRQLGRVILEIHNVVPSDSWTISMAPWSWGTFAGYLNDSELETLRALFSGHSDAPEVLRVVHEDVWPENLIERDGQLVGLVDWEKCGVGDIAIDFASLAYMSDVLDGVLGAYIEAGGLLGGEFPRRLHLARLRRELNGLHHALVYPQSGELADSLAKVRGVLGAE